MDVKNVNKRKNPLTPVKLDSKKQDKETLARREGSGWEVSIDRRGPKFINFYPEEVLWWPQHASFSIHPRGIKMSKKCADFYAFVCI